MGWTCLANCTSRNAACLRLLSYGDPLRVLCGDTYFSAARCVPV